MLLQSLLNGVLGVVILHNKNAAIECYKFIMHYAEGQLCIIPVVNYDS